MSDPDQDHEIEQWTSILGLPTWVDKKAYRNCKKCDKGFSKGHQHHCRGCGEMFCSQCTSKFHIPEHLIGKDKKGPTRICFSCRDKCLMEREKSQGDVLTDRRMYLQYVLDPESGRKFIHPPLGFVDISAQEKCGVCGSKTKNLSHCCACGDAVCDECQTNDTDVPGAFRTPKGKSSNLCKQCRFYHFDGATFVITPPSPDPEWAGIRAAAADVVHNSSIGYPMDADEKNPLVSSMRQSTQLLQDAAVIANNRKTTTNKNTVKKKTSSITSSQSTRRLSEMKGAQPASGKISDSSRMIRPSISFKAIEAEFSAISPSSPSHSNGSRGSPSLDKTVSSPVAGNTTRPTFERPPSTSQPASKPITTIPLSIRWEGQTRDVAVLEVRDGDNLQQLFNKLKLIAPELSNGNFSFCHNGVPIRSEHWKLVESKKLFPVLHLKEGTYDYLRRAQPEMLGVVTFDFDAENSTMLSLRKDQNILLVKFDLSSKWWFGYSADRSQYGWFPQDRVKVVDQQ
eukprot:TRINITY_DN4455_c0_g1_i1.p1 TRINITY_DN4455_c0_g1~~TRINITY_DN4455_c0_g1_i1.p1  ORF type:complete len:511 (-),score=103.84 TRINITY_DN4455_c0_g1_i1:791-2323(-)